MDDTRPPTRREPRFELGQIVRTRGALAACSNVFMQKCLARHLSGDWGFTCEEDKAINDEAVSAGERILSAYRIDPAKPSGGFTDNTLWIITEADRSATTLLLPEEY